MELSLRVLKVQKRLEVLMQKGIGIGSEDISLKNKLTAMQRELNKPNQYRGRLNELLPQLNYYLQNVHSLIPSDTLDNETLLAIQKVKLYMEGIFNWCLVSGATNSRFKKIDKHCKEGFTRHKLYYYNTRYRYIKRKNKDFKISTIRILKKFVLKRLTLLFTMCCIDHQYLNKCC